MARYMVAMLAAAATLACMTEAGAQTRAQKAPAKKTEPAYDVPLHAYLAKGAANACGEGCSEWIAVEGRFDADSARRVIEFLRRNAPRQLPVFFHSPGGDGRAAIAVGRVLRERGMTAGVGMTTPLPCTSPVDLSAACRAAKRATHHVMAGWRPDAACSSACVYAVIGAKVRKISPAARLGIHSSKLTMFRKYSDGRVYTLTANEAPALHKARTAVFHAELRRYIVEMGISGALFDAAQKVPHEDIAYLSRDQLAGFGIDLRDYAETPWFIVQYSNNTTHLQKWIAEARGAGGKDRRTSIVALACAPEQRVRVQYVRGLASGEQSGPVSVTVAIGDRKINLSMVGSPAQYNSIDTGGSFASAGGTLPLTAFEPLADAAAAEIEEFDPVTKRPPRIIKLTTDGLYQGIKALVAKCAQPAVPASWVGATQVPYVPAQKGSSAAVPAAPYGAFPAPEFGLGTGIRKKK